MHHPFKILTPTPIQQNTRKTVKRISKERRVFFDCEISNEGVGGRDWLTWRPWWLGKEHAEVSTEETNPRVKERNRRSRPAANAGKARLWWVLWRLFVVAIDFEEEGSSPYRTMTVPVVEQGATEQPTNASKKITDVQNFV